MSDLSEYKMKPGHYIENKDLPALAEEHLEGNPLILNYEYEVIDNGSRKDTLGFEIEFMDARKGIKKYDSETFDDALSRVNSFLKGATGRRPELRKKDMKNAETPDPE